MTVARFRPQPVDHQGQLPGNLPTAPRLRCIAAKIEANILSYAGNDLDAFEKAVKAKARRLGAPTTCVP
jgi:hypothetical protein